MKLVWSPATASKAYLETVKSCERLKESSVAELVSVMVAGWNAKLVVETWSMGGCVATSIGLAVATRHTEGKHICVISDEVSREEYLAAMSRYDETAHEVIVGEIEEAMEGLEGIDFLLVDCRSNEYARIIKVAKLGQRGAVLVCKNASRRIAFDFRWHCAVADGKMRIVRSVFLPVEKEMDVAHVRPAGGGKGEKRRWIKGIDQESGEEFVIRK